ncbi:MAG TPA: hypothetical protein VIX58_13245 [Anaerolineae bacterium]
MSSSFRIPYALIRTLFVFAIIAILAAISFQSPRPAPENETEHNKYEALLELENYWAARVTYPTGQFDRHWLLDSAQQDQAVPIGVPGGRRTYQPRLDSALTLNQNAFTALGPKPLDTSACQSPCYKFGHVSGRVNAIAIDPVSPTIAYFGSVGGGVWKTANCCSASTTWTPVTDDPLLATIAIDDLSIDPGNHNIVYAATGDLNFGSFSLGSAGLLKSTNQGATWSLLGADVFAGGYPEPAGSFPQYQAIGKVRVDPQNSNNVIAGTKTGLYFSYDGGANWTGPCLTNSYTSQRQDTTGLLTRVVSNTTVIYAAVGARGFSTTVQYNLGNNGANGIYSTTMTTSGCPSTWNLLTSNDNGWPANTATGTPFSLGGNTLGRIDIALAPSNPNVMYAQVQAIASQGTCGVGCQLGLWGTTNGGITWTLRSTASALGGCGFDYNQNWYDQGLAVDPNNPDVLFMDTYDIWKSTNGGSTLTDITCGYAPPYSHVVHVDQHALAFLPGSSTMLLTGSDGGIYLTTNANNATPTFTQLNDSVNTIEFYSGDISANFATSSTVTIAGGAQDNGSSTHQWSGTSPTAITWTMQYGGDGFYSRIEPKQGLRYYAELPNGSLLVSTSGPGGPYSNFTPGWSADTTSFIFPFEIDKFNCPGTTCNHLIGGSNRVWESITGGTTSGAWYANSPNLTKGTLGNRSFINQLAYATLTNTVAIAGTNDGNVWYGLNLGQGLANTATWVNVTGGNGVLPNRPILDVAIDPSNSLVGYAGVGGFDQNTPGTPGHVFQVSCAANCASFNWTNKTGNLPNIPVDSIIVNPHYPQQVFAGTDWGLYFTDNINVANPFWSRFQAGLPHAMIWDMAIDRGATTLAVFTRSRGAYVWPLSTGAIGQNNSQFLPAIFKP